MLALVLLPVLFVQGASESSIATALAITGLEVVALVGFTAAVGTRVKLRNRPRRSEVR